MEKTKENLEQQMEKKFAEIGRIYYENNKQTQNLDEKYMLLFGEIKNLSYEISVQEAAKMGKIVCRGCNNVLVAESKFCNMCGMKLLKEEDKIANVSPQIMKCKVCGTELEPHAKFCGKCGAKQ